MAEEKRGRGRPKKKPGTAVQKYTVSEAAVNQRREIARKREIDRQVAKTPEDIDYNARLIDHVIKIHEIALHADVNDLNSLKSCFFNYLKLCQENGMRVGNLAACAAMGIDRFKLDNMLRSKDPDKQEFAKLVKSCCSLSREELIADQKINPVIGIFWQRNFDGLRNDTEQIQAVQGQEDEEIAADDYRKRYGDLLKE